VRAVALVLVAIAAGCGGDEGDEGPTGEEIVAQAADAFADTKSFHLVYDLVNAPPAGSGLRLTHANGDVEVSDGEQKGIGLAVAGTFSGIPLESELVIVEGDGFLKDPLTGAWRELDVTQVPGAFFDLLGGVPAVLRSVQEVERAGEEQVGGVDAYKLSGKITARKLAAFLGNTPSDKLVPVELWVGQADSLIRRIEVEGPVEEGEPDDVTRKVDLSEFGKSVHIERPAS
jgi:lipoprotein LprG